MPRIFDNIERQLLPALRETLALSERADFCVGYFNLRGWRQVDPLIQEWEGGDGHCCRLLVGMQQMPQDQLRSAMSLLHGEDEIDQATAIVLKKKLAQDFRDQLMVGIPTNDDEAGLRRLVAQIISGRLVVKLFLRHKLHAKLYLNFRQDPNNPTTGYLGSSNLTLAGLSKQGELNIDVLDHDACDKLAEWFEDRWNDRFCLDISKELVEIINNSWARSEPIPPHHIYVKIACHLSTEAVVPQSTFPYAGPLEGTLRHRQNTAALVRKYGVAEWSLIQRLIIKFHPPGRHAHFRNQEPDQCLPGRARWQVAVADGSGGTHHVGVDLQVHG